MTIQNRGLSLRRVVCALLALVLTIGLLPALAEVSHGIVIGDRVLFRKSPTDNDFWDRLDRGWVAEIKDEIQSGGYTWYKVETNIPVAMDRLYTGYIRGDFFRLLTASEETAWLASKPQPYLAAINPTPVETPATATPTSTASTATPVPALTGTYGKVTIAAANLRQSPGGTSLDALQKDQLVKILESPTSTSPWYKVEVNGKTGYLQSDHLRVLSPAELAALNATEPPITQPSPGLDGATGTLTITKTSTNLRKTPGGTSLWKYPIGQVLPYYGQPVFSGGYYWAKVVDSKNNLEGYIRSDCYNLVGASVPTAVPVITPVPAPTVTGAKVRITLGGTNLRQAPGGSVIAVLNRNRELPYFGQPTPQGGYNWVYVYDDVSKLYGYVRSDCYEILNATPDPVVTPVPLPDVPAMGTLTLIKGGVNLRNAPGGLSFAQLDKGLVLSYTSYTIQGGYTWYQVHTPKGVGYVRSDVVSLNSTPPPTSTPTGGPLPTATPSTALGYIVTIKSEINLRKRANAGAEVLGRVDRAQVLALVGPVQSSDGYNWYQVTVNGLTGFLRGDCVRQLSNTEVSDYLLHGKIPSLTAPATGTPDIATGYVVTTMTSVNIRASASKDARVLYQVPNAGTAFPLKSTLTSGGLLWYKIDYNGQDGYLMGSVARMMTNEEYLAFISTQPTPTPTPAPTPTPRPEDLSNTAITNIEKVIIRSQATSSSSNLQIIYRKGTVVTLRGETAVNGSETWYAVRYSGINGWIRGDLLRVLTKTEATALEQTGDPDALPTASYRTLQLGSTGEDVTRLQQELNRRGLLDSAYINGTYGTQTQEAVRAFQAANGLVVDGIAGSNTQHKLFNTVPESTFEPGGGGTVTPTLYPVELVDWYKGDINAFWGRGETAIMTDVRTGISLRIKRWAGGYHVDGEPLTSADTAALCRIYGVSNAQEIQEKNLYQRRPLWITLKGRTFAASLYGVPHNYPDGDTISGNNFNGQLCVHFYNSRVHSSGSVDKDHMRAIQYAYDNAPSRK